MGTYRIGKMTFPTKEAKELHILRGLQRDYVYLFKNYKKDLSEGDKEIFQHLNKEFEKVIKKRLPK